MAALYAAKPAALPTTSLNNVLSNAIWDVFGAEAAVSSSAASFFTIPGFGGNVVPNGQPVPLPQSISRVIEIPLNQAWTDTYWALVNELLRINGQILDPTASQSVGNLTPKPAYISSGLGDTPGPTAGFATSGILGTIGIRNLTFEPVISQARGKVYIIVRPAATKTVVMSGGASAKVTGSDTRTPGILIGIGITASAQNNAITIYDGATATGNILGVIPAANASDGPVATAGTYFTFNAPYKTAIYVSATTVPTINVTWTC